MDKASLQEMLEAMRAAVAYTGSRTLDEFAADKLLVAAAERWLEITGEAAKRLSMPLRNAHPEVAWQQMAGMRDRLIHAYDKTDLRLVHDAVTRVIPPLIPVILAILNALPDPD